MTTPEHDLSFKSLAKELAKKGALKYNRRKNYYSISSDFSEDRGVQERTNEFVLQIMKKANWKSADKEWNGLTNYWNAEKISGDFVGFVLANQKSSKILSFDKGQPVAVGAPMAASDNMKLDLPPPVRRDTAIEDAEIVEERPPQRPKMQVHRSGLLGFLKRRHSDGKWHWSKTKLGNWLVGTGALAAIAGLSYLVLKSGPEPYYSSGSKTPAATTAPVPKNDSLHAQATEDSTSTDNTAHPGAAKGLYAEEISKPSKTSNTHHFSRYGETQEQGDPGFPEEAHVPDYAVSAADTMSQQAETAAETEAANPSIGLAGNAANRGQTLADLREELAPASPEELSRAVASVNAATWALNDSYKPEYDSLINVLKETAQEAAGTTAPAVTAPSAQKPLAPGFIRTNNTIEAARNFRYNNSGHATFDTLHLAGKAKNPDPHNLTLSSGSFYATQKALQQNYKETSEILPPGNVSFRGPDGKLHDYHSDNAEKLFRKKSSKVYRSQRGFMYVVNDNKVALLYLDKAPSAAPSSAVAGAPKTQKAVETPPVAEKPAPAPAPVATPAPADTAVDNNGQMEQDPGTRSHMKDAYGYGITDQELTDIVNDVASPAPKTTAVVSRNAVTGAVDTAYTTNSTAAGNFSIVYTARDTAAKSVTTYTAPDYRTGEKIGGKDIVSEYGALPIDPSTKPEDYLPVLPRHVQQPDSPGTYHKEFVERNIRNKKTGLLEKVPYTSYNKSQTLVVKIFENDTTRSKDWNLRQWGKLDREHDKQSKLLDERNEKARARAVAKANNALKRMQQNMAVKNATANGAAKNQPRPR